MVDRPYIFFELTNSLCSQCLRKLEAKILIEQGSVWMLKRCPAHGPERVLLSTDVEYYQLQRRFLKPGQLPRHFGTAWERGCPYDCGLCPDHEQHSCLSLVEITDHCNLECPVCYAGSSPTRREYRTLGEVEAMLDAVVRNEGQPDVVQISGGEPTLHPQLFEILRAAKQRPIRHLMLNTNGLRLANDPELVSQLAAFAPGFEIYLQFDSLRPEPYLALRGADLLEKKLRALTELERVGLSTTLVVTLKKGLNDRELGELVRFALGFRCVRGITFQPVQDAGRNLAYDADTQRLTLSEVRSGLLAQQALFGERDLIPVPCHPDALCMGYALKANGGATALSGLLDPETLLTSAGSTIVYERSAELKEHLLKLFSTAASPASSENNLKQLLCCLPSLEAGHGAADLTYENVFRVLIVQFMDAFSFDVRSVKRSCIHMAQPDGRMIPFETYNLLYRDPRRLAQIIEGGAVETGLTPLRVRRAELS
ncbi:MAG TPA: radical SAM protein [Polyangiaceae bacterium]|nr:radical SAM protein [Polyangiaceae bacterium]